MLIAAPSPCKDSLSLFLPSEFRSRFSAAPLSLVLSMPPFLPFCLFISFFLTRQSVFLSLRFCMLLRSFLRALADISPFGWLRINYTKGGGWRASRNCFRPVDYSSLHRVNWIIIYGFTRLKTGIYLWSLRSGFPGSSIVFQEKLQLIVPYKRNSIQLLRERIVENVYRRRLFLYILNNM